MELSTGSEQVPSLVLYVTAATFAFPYETEQNGHKIRRPHTNNLVYILYGIYAWQELYNNNINNNNDDDYDDNDDNDNDDNDNVAIKILLITRKVLMITIMLPLILKSPCFCPFVCKFINDFPFLWIEHLKVNYRRLEGITTAPKDVENRENRPW